MKMNSCQIRLWVFLFVLLAAQAAPAADIGSAGSQDWQNVVTKAEEEAQVTIYASDSVGNLRLIWEAFQKRFPKIKLSGTSVGRGSDLLPKIFTERRAGKFLPDIFLGAPSAIYLNLYRAKIIEPLPPVLMLPGVTDRTKWWLGKHPSSQCPRAESQLVAGGSASGNSAAAGSQEKRQGVCLDQPSGLDGVRADSKAA